MSGSALAAAAPRLLHTMLRIRDCEAMLGFYCGLLGMRERRRIEFPEQRYTLIFVGFGTEPEDPQIEFWYEWDRAEPYQRGEGYGHLGIGVRQIGAVCQELRARGIRVTRDPAPMRPGGRVIALIEDPEGNEVELLAAD
jgi:lactoylglutathione lyase